MGPPAPPKQPCVSDLKVTIITSAHPDEADGMVDLHGDLGIDIGQEKNSHSVVLPQVSH